MEQLRSISIEIMPTECSPSKLAVDESDLSTRKLREMCSQLELLQKQKVGNHFWHTTTCFTFLLILTVDFYLLQNDHSKQIMDHLSTLNALCSVLGADIKETLRNIDPSFYEAEASKNVSNVTIERLALTIGRLRETKIERRQKVDNAIELVCFFALASL